MATSNEQNSKESEPLIVITTVASFSDKDKSITHRLQPIRIMRRSGQVHQVQKVRKWYEEPVGHGHKHIHVTLQTKDGRYLDIVFDTEKVGWYLVYEEAGMLLD